jgi:ketopantoate reductase
MSLVVVGAGRVGSAFVRAAESAGLAVDVVRREGPDDPLRSGAIGTPILVCTRADALEGVIAATAPARRADLVFVQNGMIRPLLAAHGLADATQGLLYFAATSRTGPVEPGAPSLFWGPHAAAVAALLHGAHIPAAVLTDRREFSREIGTKLAWNAIFGLLGERFDESVGETLARRPDALAALAAELAQVLERGLDTTIPAQALVDRLLAYSASIPTFQARVRELPWRSGWIFRAARSYALATPLHDHLLAETGYAAAAAGT